MITNPLLGVLNLSLGFILIIAMMDESAARGTISLAPTPLIRGDKASTKMFERYIEIFFASVPRIEFNHIAFHMQDPPVRSYPIPPELLFSQSIGRVDFDELSSLVQDPFQPVHEAMAESSNLEPPGSIRVIPDRMRLELDNILSIPRNVESHPDFREMVGGYLYQTMGKHGLLVGMHDFQHELPMREYAEQFGEQLDSIYEEGTNVIGVLPGKYFNSAQDRPIIVGAHWDVVTNTSGFNDNGSGLATLLEVARVVAGSNCLDQDYSIIFVAFDSEEPGSYGSLTFVQQFVMPDLVRNGIRIQAVFIIDTIINYDPEPMKQDIPESWWDVAPDTAFRIKEKGQVGDFVALIGRNRTRDRDVMDSFLSHYDRNQFPVEPFELHQLPNDKFPTKKQLADHGYFWLSDNARFWFYRENDLHTTFPTILLTDTAFHRGYMRECYHEGCDVKTNVGISEANYQFMANVAQALVDSVLELSTKSPGACPVLNVSIPIFPMRPEPLPTQDVTQDISALDISENSLYELQPKSGETHTQDEDVNIGEVSGLDHEAMASSIVEDVTLDDPGAVPLDLFRNLTQAQIKGIFFQLLRQVQNPEDLNPIHKRVPKPSSWFSSENSPSVTYNVGTQINIGHLNVDLDPRQSYGPSPMSQDDALVEKRADIVLGSEDVNPNVLSNIIQGYYQHSVEEKSDRRKYPGKYKNSPMIIKLVDKDKSEL